MNRRRLFEIKRDFLQPQREMLEKIDVALRGERGPARLSSRAFLAGMLYLLRDGQQPTMTRLFRLFTDESTRKELAAFGLRKCPAYTQLRWALRGYATYLDVAASRTLPQVVRLQAVLGVPGQTLMESFLDWLVASTLKGEARLPMRTVDGSYMDAHCRPMKATLIPLALQAEAKRLAANKRIRVDNHGRPKNDRLKLLDRGEETVAPPADPDAWPRTISRPMGGTRHYMGYVVTTQRRVGPDDELIEKLRVGSAKDHEYDHGLIMLRRSLAEGVAIDYFLADRGFSQNPHFREGVRDMGIDLVFDLKADQRGPDGTWHGCLVIDGWPYLPSLPEDLRDVKGLSMAATRSQKEEWRAKMKLRGRYALVIKERVDARHVRVTSPALRTPGGKGERGPGCRHPQLRHTMRWADPLLETCAGKHAVDEACGMKNSTWSATFSERTNRNFSAVPFGSKAWQQLYAGRSASERGFNIFKNSDMIGLLKGRIRWRGTARVSILFGLAAAAHNIWLTNLPPEAASPPRRHPVILPLAA